MVSEERTRESDARWGCQIRDPTAGAILRGPRAGKERRGQVDVLHAPLENRRRTKRALYLFARPGASRANSMLTLSLLVLCVRSCTTAIYSWRAASCTWEGMLSLFSYLFSRSFRICERRN